MIKSMTGFGKSEALFEEKKFTVELRSVNSKQLDLSLKLPARYRSVESEMRALISKGIKRGKVECYLQIESTTPQTSAHINSEAFAAYARQIREAAIASGIEVSDPSWEAQLTASILRLPDVISTHDEGVAEGEMEAILCATREAVERMDDFRTREGKTLIEDLLQRVEKIEGYMYAVEPYEQSRVEHIKSRIREHIEKVGIALDSARLEQEMIFYVEKLDITEEKVRLKQHCDYFREVSAQEEEPGRKLGFIAQEMGREINTMGSKSNEAEMQILVVKMKDELEKIKEQVLNIL